MSDINTFNDYQRATNATAIYPGDTVVDALDYLVPGLAAEAGEVAGVYAKWIRDSNETELLHEVRDKIIKEAGDVLWMVARIADELRTPLSEVAAVNLAKLTDRKARGVLGGSGDDR